MMHYLRIVGLLAAAHLPFTVASAQIYDPVQWELTFDQSNVAPGGRALGRLTATIQDGWHIYSTSTPEGIPLDLQMAESAAVRSWSAFQPPPEVVYDPNFQADVEWYTSRADFLVELTLDRDAAGEQVIQANVRYGACDPRQCLPPKRKSASATITLDPEAPPTVAPVPADYQAAAAGAAEPGSGVAAAASVVPAATNAADVEDAGLIGFSLLALGFGLLAIFTPCVFPMVPVYMSSLIGDGNRPWGAVVRQAGTFCVGVIVLFTTIGACVSALVGPFGMAEIGSNPWVNLLIASVMVVFAVSMLGGFEIGLPSSWTSAASEKSVGSGIVATIMLSLVFTLASFACIGPFIGSILATSVAGGSLAYPIYGMGMFSVGVTAPFFVMGMFPALTSRLPRSGAWLVLTKRVVAFAILAFGLKYFSNFERTLGLDLLSRERFLAIWIVLFAAAALHLWGLLRFSDDQSSDGVGLVRFGIGAALLALAIRPGAGNVRRPIGGIGRARAGGDRRGHCSCNRRQAGLDQGRLRRGRGQGQS